MSNTPRLLTNLTPKQERFCLEYLKTGNASEAYRLAYRVGRMKADAIAVEASRLLTHPKIALRVDELRQPAIEAAQLSIERTLKEVARIAYSDVRRLFTADGCLRNIADLSTDVQISAAIASVEVVEKFAGSGESRTLIGYTKKIRLWDKNSALEKAMKYHGLYERDNQQSRLIVVTSAPDYETMRAELAAKHGTPSSSLGA